MDKKIRILMVGPHIRVQGGISPLERLIIEHAPSELIVRQLPTHDDGSKFYKSWVFFKAFFSFFWNVMTYQPDIIHIHFSVKGSTVRKMTLGMIARLLGKPYIMHAHGADYHEFYARQSRFLQSIIRKVLSDSICFIALSNSWSEFYIKACGVNPENVRIMPTPIEFPDTIPDRSGKATIGFIYLGIMDERKGAFRVIEAFSHLPENILSKARLILAGNGNVERARKMVQEAHLIEKITVRDWISPEERNTLLAESDVFVLPSRHEGIPMAMMEAMAWGLPVISSPVGGIPEVVVNGASGFLVDSDDIPSITQAMQTLIENEPLRLTMGASARESAKPKNMTSYMNALMELYREIVQVK